MTCSTCLSFRRTGQFQGECFNADAIAAHGFPGEGRANVVPDHSCRFHANKAVIVGAFAEQLVERAAIMEFDGNIERSDAEPMAAEDVRRIMFREGKAR